MMDPFKILEISHNADQETIRNAYKKLALKYHPDRHKENKELNEIKFKEISEAYEKLTNMSYQRGNVNFEDIFVDLFSNLFRKKEKKNDLSIYKEVYLSLSDTFKGKNVTIDYQRTVPKRTSVCNSCRGTGTIVSFNEQQIGPCTTCGGKGFIGEMIIENGRVELKVYPGFNEKTLFFEHKGHVDLDQSAGDLFIHINYSKDPVFIRDGSDLKCSINLPFKDSIFGTDYNLQILSDEIITIPIEGPIRNGKTLKLKGFGMPKGTEPKETFGDLFMRINVDLPNKEEMSCLNRAFKI